MFGAAPGNVIRGVPLQGDHFFFLPLWTDWTVEPNPGILDWYTVIAGVTALVALALHGAHYAALKTSGEINLRVRRAAALLFPALVLLTVISLTATLWIRPELLDNYRQMPLLYAIPALVAASLVGIWVMGRKANERGAFLCSCAYLAFMLVGAAAAVYPTLLRSTTIPR
jgi:cytochrome d ubiquinol oxidase subunit II